MKKKIMIELISIVSIFACAFAISACGEKEHTHNYGEVIAEQPATCTATGMKAHYHCADCGKYFDEDKTEVSQQQLVIPVNQGLHELNINSDVCSVCGDPLTVGLEYTLMDNDAYSVKKGSATDIDIIIPAKYNGKPVTAIGYTAFYNCTSLESVIIPDSVIAIGGGAFRNCKSLKRITIPDNVTEIGESAFYNCTMLDSLTIGSGVTSIGNSAFRDCDSLVSVIIPDGVITIGSSAFYNCALLKSVTIGSGVASIGDSAFYDCISLDSITLGDGVTEIGSNAFRGCASLVSVTIPDSVKEICSAAFYNCTSLDSVTIGSRVTVIGGSAFRNCTRLKSVSIPYSVTEIGMYAFNGCTSLVNVAFANTTGWQISFSSDMSNAKPAPDLSSPTQNAQHLTGTYINYIWKRG